MRVLREFESHSFRQKNHRKLLIFNNIYKISTVLKRLNTRFYPHFILRLDESTCEQLRAFGDLLLAPESKLIYLAK